MPEALFVGSMCSGHSGHPPRPSTTGSPNVFVNSIPLHRVGDAWAPHEHPGVLATGAPGVFANTVQAGRVGDHVSCGSTAITGSANVFIGESTEPPTITVGGVILFQDQNVVQNAFSLIQQVGFDAIDDEFETATGLQVYPPPPQTAEPGLIDETPINEDLNTPPTTDTPPTSCLQVGDPINYDLQLSSNFKLRNLSVNAVFPHSIKAQRGLPIVDIVCNLQAVAENVLEPITAQFGLPRVNSGFRTVQNGVSQHETGQAVDIQYPGDSNTDMYNRAIFIRDNLDYDQLLLEFSQRTGRAWIHISFNRAGNRAVGPRKVMTMFRGKFSPGLRLMIS